MVALSHQCLDRLSGTAVRRQFPVSAGHSQCPPQVEDQSLSQGESCLGGHLACNSVNGHKFFEYPPLPWLRRGLGHFLLHCEPGSSLSFSPSGQLPSRNPLSPQPFQFLLGAWATAPLRDSPPQVFPAPETIMNKWHIPGAGSCSGL